MDESCWRPSRWTAVGVVSDDGFDGSRGSDGVGGCDGVVVPSGAGIKVAQMLFFQDTWNNPEDIANDDHTKRSRWVQKSQTGQNG